MVYVSFVTFILILIVWFLPKNMQRRDMYMLWISIAFVEIVADILLAAPILDLYYFAGENEVTPEAFVIKLIMAPLFGIIFFNYMPKSFKRFIPYWLFWVAFSTFYEWTTVLFGYLTYSGWKLTYSAIFYVLIIPIMRWHYFYIKHDK
ncbi:hypothetical protein QA612_06340 [Evansella sp. AB-P1]|uniref:hypothetical protein n=1 Tax=Evansella sp. AB-P1 TaxID=3037653 RepID=UPI00241C41CA|nr:hypothetical protein [Evansella sp. AB-P1]MDG5787106.1 hypothetical protein [Evansella sp. AB-P1]